MNNNDERDYAEEAANRALLREAAGQEAAGHGQVLDAVAGLVEALAYEQGLRSDLRAAGASLTGVLDQVRGEASEAVGAAVYRLGVALAGADGEGEIGDRLLACMSAGRDRARAALDAVTGEDGRGGGDLRLDVRGLVDALVEVTAERDRLAGQVRDLATRHDLDEVLLCNERNAYDELAADHRRLAGAHCRELLARKAAAEQAMRLGSERDRALDNGAALIRQRDDLQADRDRLAAQVQALTEIRDQLQQLRAEDRVERDAEFERRVRRRTGAASDTAAGECPGHVGRGTGEVCALCGGSIPPALRRWPGSPAEFRVDCPDCAAGRLHVHAGGAR